jgi:hypothetical protein
MRARNIKPGFFKNDSLASCSAESRILFIGLWCYADKRGKFEWRPMRIRGEIFPYDHNIDIENILNELIKIELIIKYTVNGIDYGIIPNFELHQKPHPHETESVFPSPGDEVINTTKLPCYPSLRKAVYKRDGYICALCGNTSKLIIDHVVSIKLGGTNDLKNLQVLCRNCNKLKVKWESEKLSVYEMKKRALEWKNTHQGMIKHAPKSVVTNADCLNVDVLNVDVLNPDILNKNPMSDLNDKIRQFTLLWESYPSRNGRKDGKREAEKAFKELKLENGDFEKIISSLESQKEHYQSCQKTKKFCPEFPDLHRWLKKRRWETEFQSESYDQEKKNEINRKIAEEEMAKLGKNIGN